MNTPKPSPRLTPDQMHAILTDWHAQYADEPLYQHLDTSFEDVADKLWSAMKALKEAQAEMLWADTNHRAYGFLRAAA